MARLTILDASPEVIAKHLALTGQTKEELIASIAAIDEAIANDPGDLVGVDPSQKEKFTSVPGLVIMGENTDA